MFSTAALIVLLVIAVTNGRQVCNYSNCPVRECADPDYSADKCCGDCNNSKCKFRGRVEYNAFYPVWYPVPCQKCQCIEGETVCTNITCPSLDNCMGQGYQLKTIEGKCCPVCDYGIAEDACGLVRTGKRKIDIAVDGQKTCTADVVMHKCDKEKVTIRGRIMRCKETLGERMIDTTSSSDKDCKDVSSVSVTDVIDCSPQTDPRFEIFHG